MTTSNEGRPPVVAVVSSPSTNTELKLDVVDGSQSDDLVGALVGFRWDPSNSSAEEQTLERRVLGQITSIELRNRWHEDQAFKNIIKSRKKLPAITPQQDTRTAIMRIGGSFERIGNQPMKHGDLRGVPSTGTDILLVDQQFLDAALQSCKEDLVYLGKAYGSDIAFPMWFKHFGNGAHGIGEAYHIGVFGKTGSGKTGLAKMLLAAYARHPDMGILVIDPQGEFSLEFNDNQVGSQGLAIKEIVESRLGRELVLAPISKVQLDDWNLLEDLLDSSRFFDIGLGIRGNTEREAAKSEAIQRMQNSFDIEDLYQKDCGIAVLKHLWTKAEGDIYKTKANWESLRKRLNHYQEDEGWDEFNQRYWQPITSLFRGGKGKHRIEELVARLTRSGSQNKPIVVLDLSSHSGVQSWSDTLQKRVIAHIAEKLVENSSSTLASNDSTANTLVVLDEAHRFVPYGSEYQLDDESRMLRSELKRAVRETRKYGIGWMFISQTMQGLDTEILMQLRSMFFGYGLSFGLEFRRLEELAGGDREALNLYRSFRDPQSAMNPESKQFPFMAIGPVSPMPFAGQPMFFSAYNGTDFTAKNALEPFTKP